MHDVLPQSIRPEISELQDRASAALNDAVRKTRGVGTLPAPTITANSDWDEIVIRPTSEKPTQFISRDPGQGLKFLLECSIVSLHDGNAPFTVGSAMMEIDGNADNACRIEIRERDRKYHFRGKWHTDVQDGEWSEVVTLDVHMKAEFDWDREHVGSSLRLLTPRTVVRGQSNGHQQATAFMRTPLTGGTHVFDLLISGLGGDGHNSWVFVGLADSLFSQTDQSPFASHLYGWSTMKQRYFPNQETGRNDWIVRDECHVVLRYEHAQGRLTITCNDFTDTISAIPVLPMYFATNMYRVSNRLHVLRYSHT